MAECATAIIRQHKPNLLFVHLVETDKAQHQGGATPLTCRRFWRAWTPTWPWLIDATRTAGLEARTAFLVLGDHGFRDVNHTLAINLPLIQDGLITLSNGRVTAWKAIVLNTGGSAGVYLKDPADAATASRVRALLERHATDPAGQPLYRVIDRAQLTAWGGPAEAACYLDAASGYMFSASLRGKNLVRPSPLKGNHGSRPDNSELYTGLIAAGYGIKTNVVLDTTRLIDVAPTIAALLAIKFDRTDGLADPRVPALIPI